MTTAAHISLGYITYIGFSSVTGVQDPSLLMSCMVGANIADLDALTGKSLNKHRDSWLHTPIFWTTTFIIIASLNSIAQFTPNEYVYLFFINVAIHLAIDWFSGRTAGIRLFYPFTKRHFALFSLQPNRGNVGLIPGKGYGDFIRCYFENKFLLAVEWAIVLSALALVVMRG